MRRYSGPMKIIRIDDLPPTPWKNGGGVTREIAAFAERGAIVWRLSVADVEKPGPFSHFPGLVRVLTVLTGEGLVLSHDGGRIAAETGRPVRFDGGLAIDCTLAAGPVRDFNLMFDPGRIAMDCARLDKGRHLAKGLLLLPLGASCVVEGVGAVSPGSLLLAETPTQMRVDVGEAALLVTSDQARDKSAETARR